MAKARLTAEEAEEYTRGLGHVAVGNYELMEFARNTLRVHEALDMSFDQWVTERLGGYVRRSVDDRRRAVATLSGAKSEGGYYERPAREVAEILGIAEVTVHRDREVIEAARVIPSTPKAELSPSASDPEHTEPPTLTPEQKKAEIRRRITAGESNAEIAAAMGIGPSTVGKERTAYQSEQNLRQAQAQQPKDTRTPAQRKADEAERDQTIGDVRSAVSTAMGISPQPSLDEAQKSLRHVLDADSTFPDFEECIRLWAEIGNDLWVYGARKGLDVSLITRTYEKFQDMD